MTALTDADRERWRVIEAALTAERVTRERLLAAFWTRAWWRGETAR